jgi:hypothetical protein
MRRSTKVDKARQLNAAYSMLQRNIAVPEAMQRLSREFGLSERQAYRYLEEATHLDRPVEVSETTVPITLKLPVREKQRADHRSDCDSRVGRVSRYSEKTWLSRAHRTARFKFTLTMYLIACSIRSSLRHMAFSCLFGSVRSVAV